MNYSQNGESPILEALFEKIGTIGNYAVEFGAADGFYLSNIRHFLDKGWTGLQMDFKANEAAGVKSEFIKRDNINELFDKYKVPKKFDLLSIDIDGNDWHIWNEITKCANVVIIEYNSNFPIGKRAVLEYDENCIFDGSYGYGASFSSMVSLAEKKGYYLYQEVAYCNLIFVRNELMGKAEPIIDYSKISLPHALHIQETGKKFVEL